jgi:starvation-inducible DNA-binding protein
MSRVRPSPVTADHHHRHPASTTSDRQTQEFGAIQTNPAALDVSAASKSVNDLNQVLADTITLRDLYKKHHWQAAGPTFYMIHLLFDKHFEEQSTLVDLIAERVQNLGGIAIAMGGDVAEATRIPRPPKGREDTAHQITRLLSAHEIILREARQMAKAADERNDLGTGDLLVSSLIRTNELQAWFIDQHLR